MRWRKRVNRESSPVEFIRRFGNQYPTGIILFPAPSNADIEADHSVLIACAHDRDIGIDIVLALNNLLRTLGDVGAVGKSNVVGELLLDGDLRSSRRGIGLRSQALGIDLDPADTEELLHAAAHGRVDSLADDEVSGLVGEASLARLLLQLLRFFAGTAQSEQGDDVGLGQRRL